MVDVETAPDTLQIEEFDAVLVGSSIHVGKHHSAISEFVRTNRGALNSLPSAFFQLSLSSPVDDP